MRFIATGAAGLETLMEEEVRGFGGLEISKSSGLVEWQGTLESGYRACLWSRYSSRILLPIHDFAGRDEDELYEGVRQIRWENHLDEGGTFAVDCVLSKDAPYHHSKFASLRVKDGIADYFRDKFGKRPDVKVERPGVRVNVHADDSRTLVSIDLSGESLHRRGYRREGGEAPLKETLAAAIIRLSEWSGDVPLLDPMCGSGTLLIEAALILGDSAPGLGRKYFGMTRWKSHDGALWDNLVSEAIEREDDARNLPWPELHGCDGDQKAVKSAVRNVVQAGLEDRIKVFRKELYALRPPAKKGFLVVNPPYGERLSEKETVKYLYRCLGDKLKEYFGGWEVGLFTANPDLADMTGLRWKVYHKLYNGPISCRLFRGDVAEERNRHFEWVIINEKPSSDVSDFANRLKKNLKKSMNRAKQEGIECFRVYNRDIPEYNVSIDFYGRQVLIQEFAPPSEIDEKVASERFQAVVHDVRSVLGVGRDRVYIKRRSRQKGKAQYSRKSGQKTKLYTVSEGRCRFLVNLTDYIDTGLFLDHRTTRYRIGSESKGKRFLNLFGYTATATVHAVLGGAESSTTVDLSSTYISWAEKNMALNGIHSDRHQLIRAECLDWLKNETRNYDLIFIDPPTFSNTRKKRRIFDVQKQHKSLIEMAMERLSRNGTLIFSTNYRSFKLDESVSRQFHIIDISKKSVPWDFSRTPKIHQCWEIRHE